MAAERITGEEIIEEILNNMREGIEPLRYSVLSPGIYHIYLHEKDFNRLQGIFPQVIKETKQALDEEVDVLNKTTQSRRKGVLDRIKEKIPSSILGEIDVKGARPQKTYQAPAEGWQISFHKELNNELLPGDICVESQLSLPAAVEFGAGNQTKTIRTIRRDGVSRKTEEKRSQLSSQPQMAQKASVITGTNSDKVNSSGTVYALIHFEDEQGRQTFKMIKNQIVVGRGGSGYWVDISIGADTKISREHLRIRRDEESGKFYIKDLSAFGTTVNGQLVPSSMQTRGDERRDIDLEVELPARARIGLAGTFILDFEMASS